jgi:hypothetical protein
MSSLILLLANASSQPPPKWLIRFGPLLLAIIPAWTVFDALTNGKIIAGRGLWHRTIDRDDDPIEFWLVVIGNGFFCIVLLVAFVALLVKGTG